MHASIHRSGFQQRKAQVALGIQMASAAKPRPSAIVHRRGRCGRRTQPIAGRRHAGIDRESFLRGNTNASVSFHLEQPEKVSDQNGLAVSPALGLNNSCFGSKRGRKWGRGWWGSRFQFIEQWEHFDNRRLGRDCRHLRVGNSKRSQQRRHCYTRRFESLIDR